MAAPRVLVLAGPNGAGKTTVSRALVCDELGIRNFVNADTIARGLAGFAPETAAIAAGRVVLHRLKELAAANADFAFETNLATRSLAPWLATLRLSGPLPARILVAAKCLAGDCARAPAGGGGRPSRGGRRGAPPLRTRTRQPAG